MNSQQDVFKLTQSYLYYNSNAAIDSGKPVNAEPTTCSIGASGAYVGSNLRFATSRGAEYVKTTFKILLRQWFDPDSIKQQGTALAILFICLINKLKKDMTLEQFQNLKIGDIVVAKLVNSKQSRVNPVTNIDRGNLKLHIGKSGKWRSYLQFEVLTAYYVVKWIKRRIDSKSSPHFTIEIKSDTEVTFKVHKKVQFNQ